MRTEPFRFRHVSNAFRLLGSGELEIIEASVNEVAIVSNAFRLLGSGERLNRSGVQKRVLKGLKCLSAFGFWGTGASRRQSRQRSPPSQMPFGFWVLGNYRAGIQQRCVRDDVSNAFRLLGSGEPQDNDLGLEGYALQSQMPFGFWVLGNSSHQKQTNGS